MSASICTFVFVLFSGFTKPRCFFVYLAARATQAGSLSTVSPFDEDASFCSSNRLLRNAVSRLRVRLCVLFEYRKTPTRQLGYDLEEKRALVRAQSSRRNLEAERLPGERIRGRHCWPITSASASAAAAGRDFFKRQQLSLLLSLSLWVSFVRQLAKCPRLGIRWCCC